LQETLTARFYWAISYVSTSGGNLNEVVLTVVRYSAASINGTGSGRLALDDGTIQGLDGSEVSSLYATINRAFQA
jgi:hypothetical protein